MIGQAYVLHDDGKTYVVAALVKQNGIGHVCIMKAGKPVLIPLACAVAAPGRSVPVLATVDGERV